MKLKSFFLCLSTACFFSASTVVIAADGVASGDAAAGKIKAAVCGGCHGSNGEGKDAPVGQPSFPRIAGQVKGYFIKSVLDYKNDIRNDPMMVAISKGLSDADIANLAAYYAGLK